MDVMFYEVFKEEEVALKKYIPKTVNAGFTDKTIQAHKVDKPSSKLISIRTQSIIPSEWASSIKGILTRSAGYEHLTRYCRQVKKDIPCGYLVDYCSRAVAEHAIMMMMNLFRKVKVQLKHFENFDSDNLTGRECINKNLIVVGVGNIGSQVIDIAKGLKMKPKGVDIVERFQDVDYVSLLEGVKWADAIICTVPYNKDTEAMFNEDVLRKAKPGIIFVNVSRGEISPLEDIEHLLSGGIMGGASMDVYPDEAILAEYLRENDKKKPTNLELIQRLKENENVIFTPHNAFNTKESVEKKAKDSAESIIKFIKEQSFTNPIPRE